MKTQEEQSNRCITSKTHGDTGQNVTKPFTEDWWNQLDEEDEFREATRKIGFILQYSGKWNIKARVLEVQCGLGSMPQFMFDNGYEWFRGTDNCDVLENIWDNKEILKVAEPYDTGYEDNTFHLVCWYSMADGRIRDSRVPLVLDEMNRVGHGIIILKPFEKWSKSRSEEFLAYMLEHDWVCFDHNPVTLHYMFYKG